MDSEQILFDVIIEWRASFARLDTENTLGKHELTSVLLGMLVWPSFKTKAAKNGNVMHMLPYGLYAFI